MSKVGLGAWLAANAGIISIVGALVIFFSWTVTNTLGQRYSRLKQSVETADGTFRLYTTLHDLRGSLNSVAMETVYAREAAESSHNQTVSRESIRVEVDALRRDYTHTRLSAHQIIELMDFTSQTLAFSAGVGTETATAKQIQNLHDDIYAMYREVQDRDRAVEAANSTPEPDVRQLRPVVTEYVSFVRHDAIPRVRGFYQAITNACNTRQNEGREQLARSQRNAARAARVALALYIVGSLLVLSGQYFDKVHKKDKQDAQTSTR